MKGFLPISCLIISLLIFSCDDKTTVSKSCGDGFVDPGEECDKSTGGETCASLGHYNLLGTLTCRADCFYDRTSCGGRCGDNQVDAEDGEACDGTHLNGNSCVLLGYHGGTLACQTDCTGYDESDCEAAGRCGDGALQGEHEDCEDGDLGGATCQSLGFYRGTLACGADCAFDTSGCAERCGDGVIQASEGEACDGSNLDGQTCGSQGYNPGTLACDAACAFDVSGCDGSCGDGEIQTGSGETCDGANLDGQTCESLGERPGTLVCDAACGFDLSGCGGRCGDGQIQAGAGEQCEGTDLAGETCGSLGYYGGTLTCGADCRFDLLDCAGFGRCGDGLIQTTVEEDCDGTNLGGGTCESEGFYTGTLACDGTCTFDHAGCALWCGDGLVQTEHGEACDGAVLGGASCESAWSKHWGLPGCASCELTNGTCTNTLMFGTSTDDYGTGIAVDGLGNIVIVGYTGASMDGQPHAGNTDLFVVKYSADGARLWTRVLGTAQYDQATAVALDTAGNIYVTGSTSGSLDNQGNAGSSDAFLVKYDAAGNRLWTRTWGSSAGDGGQGIAVSGTDAVYIGGYASGALDGQTHAGDTDIFLAKFNAAGTKQWAIQTGTAGGDTATRVAVDGSGNAYITGYVQGSLHAQTHVGTYDVFVIKYNASGARQWTVQWGTALWDLGYGIAVDGSGNILVTGQTQAGMESQTYLGGSNDMFITKLFSNGVRSWTRLYGTSGNDFGTHLAVDGIGNAIAVGPTDGTLSGHILAGGFDSFLVKVSSMGVMLIDEQWGSTQNEGEPRVALDAAGHVLVTGHTRGSIEGQSTAGLYDVFLTYVP